MRILQKVLIKPGSLGKRLIKAGGWSIGGKVASQGLQLVSNLIMTRLLVPEAFGLMALVTTVIVAANLTSDMGIEQSIVREKDGDSDFFLRVAWTTKIMRGAAMAAGVLLVALTIAAASSILAIGDTAYADPRLPWLLILAAFAPLMAGLESTKKELATRHLEFSRIIRIDLGAQIISMGTMIAFASISPTVWALTTGLLIGRLTNTIASHLVLPGPKMALVWDAAIASRLWHFGKWLIGSSSFHFIAMHGDRVILGALVNTGTFGVYSIARIWITAMQQLIQVVTGKLGFSAIGEVVRNRPKDVKQVFRKFQMVVDVLCFVSFLGLFFIGPTFIRTLYPTDYILAADSISVLALGLLVERFKTLGQLSSNIGNSRAAMYISLIRAATLCISLPFAFDAFGLEGALYAVVLSPLVSVPYALSAVRSLLGWQIAIDAGWVIAILLAALATVL